MLGSREVFDRQTRMQFHRSSQPPFKALVIAMVTP